MLYTDVLSSGEPDAVYEFFWLMFKDSVVNFNKSLKPLNLNLNEIEQEVPVVSSLLNDLKKEKKYNDIIAEIDGFLVKFAWTALLTVDDPQFSYNINILHTNINRWLNLPGIKETDKFAVLHFLLGLSKHSNQHQNNFDLIKYTRGPPTETLNVHKIVSRATKFSLRKDRPIALTRLTSHTTLQPIVVEVLREIGLEDAPTTIRDGHKIISMYKEATEN